MTELTKKGDDFDRNKRPAAGSAVFRLHGLYVPGRNVGVQLPVVSYQWSVVSGPMATAHIPHDNL